MISSKAEFQKPNVVVIDFGLSQGFSGGARAAGTPGYMPAEVLQFGLWTPKGDTFSMGVTFYSMCTTGQSPFYYNCQSAEQVTQLVMQGRMPPTHPTLQRIPALNQMLTRMLCRDFHQRPTIARVLEDPWLKNASGAAVSLDGAALAKMSKQNEMSTLQKGLLADMASRENLAQMEDISATFVAMDKDNNGLVDANEARAALRGKMPQADIEALIGALIGDGGGSVAYTAFMGQMVAARKGNSSQMLWKIFQELDTDNGGTLCQSELQAMLNREEVAAMMGGKSGDQVLAEFGWDRKSVVTWEEFKEGFEKTSGGVKAQFEEGQDVEYYSPSYGKWVPCQVTKVRGDAAITISVKPGFFITVADQRNKVRAPGGPQASPGLNLLHGAMGM